MLARVLLPLIFILTFVARAKADVNDWHDADEPTKQFALRLARRAFDTYAKERRVISAPEKLPPLLKTRGGVFVSTMVHGAPRTCMGALFPIEANLAQEIIAAAVAAAGHDRRFAPVKPSELKEQILIVSFVGQPRAIGENELDEIDPLRDGLVARGENSYGVVLPGETKERAKMIKWAKVRAGTKNGATEFYKIEAVRVRE